MKRIVVLASGSGSNAENIIKYFQKNATIKVTHVLSNKKDAKVLEKAKKHNINTLYINTSFLTSEEGLLSFLKEHADYIVLAGFLQRIPKIIVTAFPNKIINIHPALLPKYGGKGMYGMYVHKAVVENKETKTGMTIHFVNENYDEGAIIFQQSVTVVPNDTPKVVAAKVLALEHAFFPKIIEKVINEQR